MLQTPLGLGGTRVKGVDEMPQGPCRVGPKTEAQEKRIFRSAWQGVARTTQKEQLTVDSILEQRECKPRPDVCGFEIRAGSGGGHFCGHSFRSWWESGNL